VPDKLLRIPKNESHPTNLRKYRAHESAILDCFVKGRFNDIGLLEIRRFLTRPQVDFFVTNDCVQLLDQHIIQLDFLPGKDELSEPENADPRCIVCLAEEFRKVISNCDPVIFDWLVVYFTDVSAGENLVLEFERLGINLVAKGCSFVLGRFELTDLDPRISEKTSLSRIMGNLDTGSKSRIRSIDSSTSAELVDVDPKRALQPRRFDIAIKVLVGRYWREHRFLDWVDQLYYQHLDLITGSNEEIREFDGSGKSGIDDYINSYRNLLNQGCIIDDQVIPCDRDFVLLDGAHRVSASIVRGERVKFAKLDIAAKNLADYDFFRKGISPEVLNECLIEYSSTTSDVTVALIFPSVRNKNYGLKKLGEIGRLVARTDLYVTPSIGQVLISLIYNREETRDSSEHKKSLLKFKAKNCFPCPGYLTIVALDSSKISRKRRIKQEIRDFYGLNHDSIHMSDSHTESRELIRMFMQDGQVFYNFSHLYQPTEATVNRIDLLIEYALANEIDPNDFVIGGSVLLDLFSKRSASDLDLICAAGLESCFSNLPNGLSLHSSQISFYGLSQDELVFNPENYFWFRGLKFLTPKTIINFKNNRGELKDYEDLYTIQNSILNSIGILNAIWLPLRIFVGHTWHYFIFRLKSIAPIFLKSWIKKIWSKK